jgi:hypothetical protein
MRPIRQSFFGFVLLLGAAGVVAAEADAGGKKTCVQKRDVNVITPLDDGHALVKASAGRFYLFTLGKACQGFRLARRVAFSDGTTRVCDDGSTLLSFEYPALGPMRCRVEGIERVADRAAAEALIAERAGPQ